MAVKKRIMMISTHGYVSSKAEFGKPDTGGQVVYVLELSKSLARLGYHVDILTRLFEKQPKEERVADRVRILRFRCGGHDFIPKEFLCDSIPEWVTNVKRHLAKKRLKYEFINSHYWDAGMAGQALATHLKIPHIHTPHSIGAWKRDNMGGDPAKQEKVYNFKKRIREEKIIYDECDIVVATTPVQRDIVIKSEYDVPLNKIRVIPPGYDDTKFFPVSVEQAQALKREYGFENDKIVLALGRMAKNKGYDLLIRAMKPVLKRVKNAKLLLAAGSSHPPKSEIKQMHDLKQLARKLNIHKNIIFGAFIPEDKLPDYYRLADVFALSSRYEPFGMTAIEAMACGTPAVITTEGGLQELLTWGVECVYANPFDYEAYGMALATVLQYEKINQQLSRYGTFKARAAFTWMGIAQKILTVFHDRMESRRIDGLSAPSDTISRVINDGYSV